MALFLYIVVFAAIPTLGYWMGVYAIAAGAPLPVVWFVAAVIVISFSWHCARIVTAGKPW